MAARMAKASQGADSRRRAQAGQRSRKALSEMSPRDHVSGLTYPKVIPKGLQ